MEESAKQTFVQSLELFFYQIMRNNQKRNVPLDNFSASFGNLPKKLGQSARYAEKFSKTYFHVKRSTRHVEGSHDKSAKIFYSKSTQKLLFNQYIVFTKDNPQDNFDDEFSTTSLTVFCSVSKKFNSLHHLSLGSFFPDDSNAVVTTSLKNIASKLKFKTLDTQEKYAESYPIEL